MGNREESKELEAQAPFLVKGLWFGVPGYVWLR